MKMRKLLLLLFTFICFSNVPAQELETIMKQGNDFYQNKQFDEAINSYETILKQGYISSELFYNLGNAYYRVGQLGKSILYFEKYQFIN